MGSLIQKKLRFTVPLPCRPEHHQDETAQVAASPFKRTSPFATNPPTTANGGAGHGRGPAANQGPVGVGFATGQGLGCRTRRRCRSRCGSRVGCRVCVHKSSRRRSERRCAARPRRAFESSTIRSSAITSISSSKRPTESASAEACAASQADSRVDSTASAAPAAAFLAIATIATISRRRARCATHSSTSFKTERSMRRPTADNRGDSTPSPPPHSSMVGAKTRTSSLPAYVRLLTIGWKRRGLVSLRERPGRQREVSA